MRIFFNSDADIGQVAKLIFEALGIGSFWEGDSHNVLGGTYNSYSIFGINIKLELNSYDYEDTYRFMLCVKKDMISSLKIDMDIENKVSEIVLRVLQYNLNIPIAVEKNGELLVDLT